ncbi:MAG: hypothetical protein Kow0029_19160 [Candidatus Rifleibacteriota bacterium]
MFIRNKKRGQGLVEYALIIALLALAVVAPLTLLQPKVTGAIEITTAKISDAVPAAP